MRDFIARRLAAGDPPVHAGAMVSSGSTAERASAGGMRVAIVDECAPRRLRLRRRLEGRGVVVCAEAAGPGEWLRGPGDPVPDLWLVGADTAGRAVTVAGALADDRPGVRTVLIGPAPSDADLLDAVLAGVSGYLSDDLEARLVPALCDIAAGRPAFPARLNTLLVERLRQPLV